MIKKINSIQNELDANKKYNLNIANELKDFKHLFEKSFTDAMNR